MLDGQLRGDVSRGLAALDAALRATPVASVPITRDQSMWLAYAYSRLGATAKAREVLSQHEARRDTLGRRQDAVFITRALTARVTARKRMIPTEFSGLTASKQCEN